MVTAVPLAYPLNLPRLSRIACNAAVSDVIHAGVDHLRLPRCWAITQAVIGRTEMRAAFDYFARNPELRLRGIVAFVWRNNPRIDCRTAAGLDHLVSVALDEPVTSPFPHVARHVIQTVAVRRERSDRGSPLIAVLEQVLPGKLSLPTVGHRLAAGRMLIAPRIFLSIKSATSSKLPLRFGRKFFSCPACIGFGVLISNVHHWVLSETFE